MGEFNPFIFVTLLVLLLFSAFKNGGKTSYRDKDIDDYWSDG